MKRPTRTLLLLMALSSVPALADMEKFGNLEVHYNVITTDTLQPSVAQAYGIERSQHRALITVAVTRVNPLGVPKPVAAAVSAHTVNLIEQHRAIDMRKINEGDAIYYLGDFALTSPDVLRFTLNVDEPDTGQKHKIEFERNY